MKGLAAFASEHLGLEFYAGQERVLAEWAASGKRKAVLALGRRSGKGLMAAVAALFNAIVEDYSGQLRPGETRFIVVVANRIEQAREFIRVVRELVASAPDADLAALVDLQASTQDEVHFRTGVVIRAMPCSSRSTRGLPISLLVLDEVAHMATTEDGFAAGKQVYRALLPSTAQFGDRGYVMLTSSPSWASGIFWDLFQAGVSEAAEDVFVAQVPTWEMNPTISRESLEPEFRGDPDSARVEYGAEFAEGAGAYLTAIAIAECVIKDRRVLPPLPGVDYYGAADPAFAAGGDAFTFAIGHRVGEGEAAGYVLDRLETWSGKRSPLNSDDVLDEIAALAFEYNVRELRSDQYAITPIADGLKRRGLNIRYEKSAGGKETAPGVGGPTLQYQPLSNELKATIYGALKRAINNGRVELLDDDQLVSELVHLQRRPTPSGKVWIGATAGHHDDRAMAVATVVHSLSARSSARNMIEYMRDLAVRVAAPAPTAAAVIPAEIPPADPTRPPLHCSFGGCYRQDAIPGTTTSGGVGNFCPAHLPEMIRLGVMAGGLGSSPRHSFGPLADAINLARQGRL